MSDKKILALCASMLFLSACGGGSDSNTTTPGVPATTLTGVFIDSPVAGLQYQTNTISGTSNTAGEYDYLAGETVTFSIGDIVFGSAAAGPVLTPLSLVAGARGASDLQVSNIVRLLLTLDDDGDPDNGIVISSATAAATTGQSVDFTASDLSSDPGMSTLLPQLPERPEQLARV